MLAIQPTFHQGLGKIVELHNRRPAAGGVGPIPEPSGQSAAAAAAAATLAVACRRRGVRASPFVATRGWRSSWTARAADESSSIARTEPADSGSSGPSRSIQKDVKYPALVKAKKKLKGFSPTAVLMDRKGNVLSGGDGAEIEGAQEFTDWLEERGALGVDNIILRFQGGVALRAWAGKVKKNSTLLSIPRACWLLAKEERERDVEESLAWLLLQEVWKGEDSEYKPFIRVLLDLDASLHPINWEEDEVDWLESSLEGHHLVKQQRAIAEKRVARLAVHITETGKPAIPTRLLSDKDALKQEIRWALSMVEMYAVESQDESGGPAAAFVPIMGNVRNAFKKKALNANFQEADKDEMLLHTFVSLKPGDEITQRFDEELSGAAALAYYGVVPGAEVQGRPSDLDLLNICGSSTTILEIPPVDMKDAASEGGFLQKLQLVKRYAGLDLLGGRHRDSVPYDQKGVKIPHEACATGRVLPLARFMITDTESLPGDTETATKIWFNRHFKQCEFAEYPEVKKTKGVDIFMDDEIPARKALIEWLEAGMISHSAKMMVISSQTGIPPGDVDGVLAVVSGQMVMAHFKTRTADGSVGKSKAPREAMVLLVVGDKIRVEFTANKRRHEVPNTWITDIRAIPNAGLLESGIPPLKLKRGKLAMTLLRTERAMLSWYTRYLQETVKSFDDWIQQLGDFRKGGEVAEEKKIEDQMKALMESEREKLDWADISLKHGTRDLKVPDSERYEEDKQPPILPEESKEALWDMPSVFNTEKEAVHIGKDDLAKRAAKREESE